ncbi:MAG: hypothetical protein HFE63_10165 [Clostridiales bacterium]|nr:hypothetical protein [Clostridiales bacterium]
MKKKYIAKLLTLAIMLSTLTTVASCGNEMKTPNDVDSTNTNDTGDSSDTTAAEDDNAPEIKDFGGADFNILLWNLSKLAYTEENGDVINDATYRRNAKVQELYNVNFKYDVRDIQHPANYGDWLGILTSSIMADDDAYQLAGGYAYRLASDSLNGNFQNLNDNPNIDFSQPWWPSNLLEVANLGGNMTIAFGNMDSEFYNVNYAVYFNKKLAEEYSITDLYDSVYDGSWTVDKLFKYAQDGARDLNGDQVIDDNDRYGWISEWNMAIDAFITAGDIKITEYDSDHNPKLVGLTERYVDLQQKLSSFIYNSGAVSYKTESDQIDLFMNGQGLFLGTKLGNAHTMREMNDDFGILPYPKYDEAQEDYYTYNACGNSTGYIIPITADGDMAGAILEALAYYGWRDIRPEYIERALKGKSARDDESAAMLDMIFDNIAFEFTNVYAYAFGDEKSPTLYMRLATKQKKELSSMWAANEKSNNETMERLINSLK